MWLPWHDSYHGNRICDWCLLSQAYYLWQTHWSSWTIQKECLPNVCWFYQLKWFSFLMDLLMAKLIKFAKMAGVMHEADHTYSTQSTWWLHQLATDVPFIACVINWPCTFTYSSDLSNFITWIVLSCSSISCFFIL